MKKSKASRLPYAGTLPITNITEAPFPGQRTNPLKYFGEDDPVIQRAYKLGALKKSRLAELHTNRDPETTIRVTAKALQDTPFRKWDAQLIEDAKKYLPVELINKIIADNQKKMK
jgi:hypothetical protein